MKKEIIKSLKVVLLAVLLVAGASFAWTPPPAPFPADVDPPITVTGTAQVKGGSTNLSGFLLYIKGLLAADNLSVFGNTTVAGNVTVGSLQHSNPSDTPVCTDNNGKLVLCSTTPPPTLPVLTVSKSGAGAGTVTSNPTGINCGATCSASFASGSNVTLTASPASGSTFGSWSGCSSTSANTCTVTNLTQSTTVTVTFNTATTPSYTLTVNKTGGTGTVTSTSNPTQASQINCGGTCAVSYPSGTTVALTVTASGGSTFSSWSGCSSITGASPNPICNVSMNSNKTVTATFNPPRVLTIDANPSWAIPSGGIKIKNSGTNTDAASPCFTHFCQRNIPDGTSVDIHAYEAQVTGAVTWGGDCPNTNPKVCGGLVMNSNKYVTINGGGGGGGESQ